MLGTPHGAKEAPMHLLVVEIHFHEGQHAPIYNLEGSTIQALQHTALPT